MTTTLTNSYAESQVLNSYSLTRNKKLLSLLVLKLLGLFGFVGNLYLILLKSIFRDL